MAKANGTSTKKVSGLQREQQALDLRVMGKSYMQIAQILGISKAGAHNATVRAIKKLQTATNEAAEQVRELEVQRLDKMLAIVMAQVEMGDLGAVDRALKIMARRASLLGLDAPERLQQSGDITFRVVKDD